MDNENLTDEAQKSELSELSEPTASRPIRHHRREERSDRFFVIRNILNIIFMIGAVVGVLVFYFYGRTPGLIIILTSMVFKMAECCFRLMRL